MYMLNNKHKNIYNYWLKYINISNYNDNINHEKLSTILEE